MENLNISKAEIFDPVTFTYNSGRKEPNSYVLLVGKQVKTIEAENFL